MAFERKSKGPHRNRYIPFRVLGVLQFGILPEMLEVGVDGNLTIDLPRTAKRLRLRVVQLVEALEWLNTHQYILNYTRVVAIGKPSHATLQLSFPPNIVPGDTHV